MTVRIEPSWNRALAAEWDAPYFKLLTEFVRQEYRTRQVFPPGRQIFAAFDAAPFDQVKVVILGQDPYHGIGQANGMCFSVNEGVPMPPSLINIFKEVHDASSVKLVGNCSNIASGLVHHKVNEAPLARHGNTLTVNGDNVLEAALVSQLYGVTVELYPALGYELLSLSA
jgi:hypothetical protein